MSFQRSLSSLYACYEMSGFVLYVFAPCEILNPVLSLVHSFSVRFANGSVLHKLILGDRGK